MVNSEQERVGQRIKRLEQELTAAKHAALRPFKINVPQYGVLYELSRQSGLSGAALARRCMVTPQTMSSVLSNLEGRGLVERTPHPIHLQILEVRLTSAGKTLIREADVVVEEIEQLLDASFAPGEAAPFLEQLERCEKAVAAWSPKTKS
ncbi:MarR family transcriptional regulator [Streptomyces sp. NBC_00158]|uniref:MarR family winged helix-turn-helix transcriptional regulator n=1 Tax=Streptomyces sp. NBC_00158 TaxID=2903627 RepID=UPI002F915468